MTSSLFSGSLSDLDSSSDHGFLFFTFLAPLGAGGFLTRGAPETDHWGLWAVPTTRALLTGSRRCLYQAPSSPF